eukprot:gene3371-13404_t
MEVPSAPSLLSTMPNMDEILERYSTPEAYLQSMQLHSSAEYFVATQEGRMEAHLQGRASWRKYSIIMGRNEELQFRINGVDFEDEPWGKALLEVQGCGYAIFATKSYAPEGVRTFGFCNFEPQGAEIPRAGYIRCLVYVGSYMMEFSSAGKMLSKMPDPGSASRWLLEAVASPGTHPSPGTPPHVATLIMGPCIINGDKEHAVRHLRPGLDTIHGPPGTGKSTTIYHIVASRVKKWNKTLVTCTRNQAVNAVVEKVAAFGCVVFGNPKRLGIDSLRYTLDALVKRDPTMCWWNAMSRFLGQAKNLLKCHHDMSMYGPCLQRLAGVEADIERQPLAKRKACGSTVEATARMNRDVIEAFKAIGSDNGTLKIDTCIVDEAGSVLESAIPVLLFWEPANLVLLPRPHPRPCLWVQCQGAEKGHRGGGISNPKEVIAVAEQAELVVASGRYPLSFVISFYNKQKEALQKQFEAKPILAKALKAGTLLVLSVDACQGSEADCVIISPVRTKKVSSFGKSKHRLCVALSRAKHLCIIVGHATVFQSQGGDLWRQITGHFVAGINPGLLPAFSPGIGQNPGHGHGSGSSTRAAGAATATSRADPDLVALACQQERQKHRKATSRPGGSGVPSPSPQAQSKQLAMSRMMMMSLEKLDDETSVGPMPAGPVTKHPGPSSSRAPILFVKMLRAAFEAGAGSKPAGPGTSRTPAAGPGTSRHGPPGTGPSSSRVPTPSGAMLRAAYETGGGPRLAGPGTSRPGPPGPVTAVPALETGLMALALSRHASPFTCLDQPGYDFVQCP